MCSTLTGGLLFDVDAGHEDEAVEELIDEVNVEYLDLLLDLTGDECLGSKMISVVPLGRPGPGHDHIDGG